MDPNVTFASFLALQKTDRFGAYLAACDLRDWIATGGAYPTAFVPNDGAPRGAWTRARLTDWIMSYERHESAGAY